MKDIVGYEGLYAVTSCGRVWSYKSNRFLKEQTDKDGYKYIVIKHGSHTFRIHREVAKAYIQNPNNLPQVNHKDEDKTNNCINNLEWCNEKYNANYGTRNKRSSKNKLKYKLIKCVENNKKYDNLDDISIDLLVDRKQLGKYMSRSVEKGWAINGYHFKEVIEP